MAVALRQIPWRSVDPNWRMRLKSPAVLAGVLLLLMVLHVELRAAPEVTDVPPESIARMGVTSQRMILLPKHIFVSSGWITVQPDVTRLGFGHLFAPPLLANPMRVTCTIDGRPIEVVDYTWYPSEFALRAKPASGLDVSGRIVPLPGISAVIGELTLTNRSSQSVSSEIALTADGAVGHSPRWPFSVPRARVENTRRMFKHGRLLLRSDDGVAELALAIVGGEASSSDEGPKQTVMLRPGERQTHFLVAVLDAPEKTPALFDKILASPERFVAEARLNWQRRIKRLESVAPAIETPNAELAAFYRRALFSLLACRWDSDAMLFRPWYATSGMDGGAVCSYLWDLSYTSKMAVLCDAKAVRRYLLAFTEADLAASNALNPLDGRALGNDYSYNDYNLTRLAYDYVTLTGDVGVLSETVRDETFLDYLYRYALRKEDLDRPPVLVDYGTNKNLLELKRTDDYQHYTPSPNGERVLIYEHLDKLFSWAGRKTPHDLAARAEAFREHFLEKLWDPEHRWFRCLDRRGQPRIAYSIQIFDLLRTGMLSREQQLAVLSHLNEDEFLSPYGVHSLSKQDEGYDPNDADWGGPGAFAGDPPELVIDLIAAGHEKLGVDVLRRILWWSEFPYIPQAVLAADRDYRTDGRANVVAGLAGCQAILNGLLGIRVDGEQIHFNPVNDPIVFGLSLSNLNVRGQRFDLKIADDGKGYLVRTDGQEVRRATGLPTAFPLPRLSRNTQ
ncbi:MAG: hypothetical protein GX621_04875 [Pirellulaceae bacterium]|nr:hypothetical protein [Pirellulaceae bacterium]